MRNLLLPISFIVMLCSCFEPDEILPAVKNSSVNIEIDLSQNQASFLDLQNINTSSDNEFKDWQLKFQNDANRWSIYLNTLSQVAVHNTRITKYDSITEYYDTKDIVWQLDVPTNSGSYPGLGTWGDFNFEAPKSYKNIYLIRWVKNGITEVYKLQILDARLGAYHIRYGSLDGTYINSVWVEKETTKQHSYFSLAENKILKNVEPPKDKWNLCLTYLTDSISKHPQFPFITTPNPYFGIYQGLLLNQANSLVYVDTTRTLDEITFFNSNNLNYINIDEMYNVFSSFDPRTQELVLKEKTILIIKDNENLFAIKPRALLRGSNNSFSIDLEIKKL